MLEDRGQPTVFRFAPSPNGRLHLGHALSAFMNRDMATACGGTYLVRIEDIDQTRCTPELETAMLADLAWLGLSSDESERRQSDHLPDYAKALASLEALGVTYPAFLSRGEVRAVVRQAEARGEIWPRDPEGVPLFPSVDRMRSKEERRERLARGEKHQIRLDMGKALALVAQPLDWVEFDTSSERRIVADAAAWGDIVLSRSDAPSSYALSVVVDDAAQGVTHVVRGMDLFHATAVQRLLQVLLGLPAAKYRHHRLILGEDGRKLSKSSGSTALAALREQGATPSDIRALLGI